MKKPTPTTARVSENGQDLTTLVRGLLGYLLANPHDVPKILEKLEPYMLHKYGPVIDSIRFKIEKYRTFEPDEIIDDLIRQGHADLADDVPGMVMNPSAKPFTDAQTIVDIHTRSIADSVSLSEVEETRVTYEWPGRIPAGKITILAGVQGDGKTLVSTDIAAKKSAGYTWPDGAANKAGKVLIMSGEDDLSDTIVPRLRAAGADLSRIFSLQLITKMEPNEETPRQVIPTLTEDLEALEREIQIRKPRLLIIDPINAFLPGIDTHRDADLRSKVFTPLKMLAEQYRVAVIGIMHLNKSNTQSAIHRVSGSIAYTAAARAAYLLTDDPGQPGRKLILSLKFNCGPKPDGMAFKIMQNNEGLPIVAWERDPVDIDADEALKPDHTTAPERSEAEDFLLQILANGPVHSNQIFDEADDLDIKPRTLKRAKSKLEIQAERRGESGKQGGGKWYWKLPETTG